MADDLKAKGNAAFAAGNFEEAVEHFTAGIKIDDANHVLYSNRSAAQASLKRYTEAREDAEKVVHLKPDWPKGYSRLGAANMGLGSWDDAVDAYKRALQLEPSNEGAKKALEDAVSGRAEARSSGGGRRAGGLFGPEFMGRLAMDPRTREYLTDPEFMQMMRNLQQDPMSDASMGQYLQNEKFQQAMAVGLGVNMSFGGGGQHGDDKAAPSSSDTEMKEANQAASGASKPAESALKPEPVPEAMDEDSKAAADAKQQAVREKELGNAAYKAKKFDEAIKHYDAAVALDDTDISFLTNRNADTLKRLNDTERRVKEAREQAYIDLAISSEEREKGNQAFKDQQYPEAVQHYSEALKRGPPAVNPEAYKLFSNRAACFTKLGAYPDGIKDADECISLKPDFAKGYSRKGHLQFFMKDYDKAIATYQEGLDKADKDNEELKNGITNCLMTINKMRTGQASEEEVKQRQARAMQDPEVQRILTDPVMRQVLEDLQSDPKNSQHHLQHPQIMANIDKLVTAGLVQMR